MQARPVNGLMESRMVVSWSLLRLRKKTPSAFVYKTLSLFTAKTVLLASIYIFFGSRPKL